MFAFQEIDRLTDRFRGKALRGLHIMIYIGSPRVIQICDALLVGQVSVILGGGRSKEEEAIDHGVGIFVEKQVGEIVEKGESTPSIVF